VQPDTARAGELAIQRIAHEIVREPQTPASAGHVGHQTRSDRLLEFLDEHLADDPARLRQHLDVELAAEHRGQHQRMPRRWRKPPSPSLDHLADAVGDHQSLPLHKLP
jgi:hypothetical protein